MSNARKFAGNSLALTVASLSTVLLGAVYRIFIARYLGEAEFGKYVFIVTYLSYFSVISLLGVRQVVVREVAKHPEKHLSITRQSLKIRIPSTILAFSLAYGILLFLHKGHDVCIGLFIYGASLFTVMLLDTAEGMLVGRETAFYVTVSSLVSNLLKIGSGIYLLRHGAGLIVVLSLYTLISFLNAGMSWVAYRWVFRGVKSQPDEEESEIGRFLLKESWPFLWLMLISRVYYKNDILILSFLKGDIATGRYGAAYQPIDALVTIASSLGAAAYPVMSRLSASGDKHLQSFHNTLSRYVMLLFQFIAVVLTAVGPELVSGLFGRKYSAAAPVLRLLAWMPASEAVTILMGTLLGATANQKITVRLAIVAASMNVAMCLALIPRFGYTGAAYGTVVSGYLNMLYVMYTVNARVQLIDWSGVLLKPILCAGSALGVLFLVSPIAGHFGGLIAASAAYFAVIMLTKALARDDFRVVSSAFRKTPVRVVE